LTGSTIHRPSTSDGYRGAIRKWLTEPEEIPSTHNIVTLRAYFSEVINAWIDVAGVRLMFGWHTETSFKFASPPPRVAPTAGILPALAVYIMLLANRSRGLAVCSNPACSSIFTLSMRQPQGSINRGHYCPACRKGKASSREATRTYQQRERENPDRKKRKRLTPQQREEIKRHWQEHKAKESKSEFVKRMAEQYGTSGTNVYRLIKKCESRDTLDSD
jgi:hypothetical protein